MRRIFPAPLALLAVVVLVAVRVPPLWAHDTGSQFGLSVAIGNMPALPDALAMLTERANQDCGLQRFRGLVADRLGQAAEGEAAWWGLTACPSDAAIVFLRGTVSQRGDLADAFSRLRPDSVDAWLWLADTMTTSTGGWAVPQVEDERLRAIEAYQHALALSPSMSVVWRELGDLLVAQNDQPAAIEAYLNSCVTGDAGSNGCWRAGLTMEQTGDIVTAIHYYRLSQWSTARQRADQLEQQLNSAK